MFSGLAKTATATNILKTRKSIKKTWLEGQAHLQYNCYSNVVAVECNIFEIKHQKLDILGVLSCSAQVA